MSSKKIAYLYVGKMVLNLFRQVHGSEEGKYVKIWDEKNNLEDNYFLLQYLKKVENENLKLNVEDIIDYLNRITLKIISYRNNRLYLLEDLI
jgi:hypothetical protein